MVVAPEVTGFLVGPLVARALGAGFVEAYRAGARRPIAEPMSWAEVPADHRGQRQLLGVRDGLVRPDDQTAADRATLIALHGTAVEARTDPEQGLRRAAQLLDGLPAERRDTRVLSAAGITLEVLPGAARSLPAARELRELVAAGSATGAPQTSI